MQINFTGYKNMAYHTDKNYPLLRAQNGKLKYSQEHYVKTDIFNTELTNDENGNDLDEFYTALDKSDIKDAINPIAPNCMNLAIVETYPDRNNFQMILNNKDLNINDENITLISYLTKFLKSVVNTNDDNFEVTKEYIEDDITPQKIILGDDITNYFEKQEDYQNYMEYIHDPTVIKDGTTNMIDTITQKMLDYFS